MNLIELNRVGKAYTLGGETIHALRDLTLHIPRGEFVVIEGPSGSGKTTLLNILGSLDAPSKGQTNVLGTTSGDMTPKVAATLRKKHIGFIFQTYNLMPVYTVFENVEFPLLLLKTPAAERKKAVLEALDWVGLSDKVKSKPQELSRGES